MNNHGDWMLFGGGYMWLIWILIIGIVVVLVKSIIVDSDLGKKNESALEILNKRLANGEINEDEYKRLKKDIVA